jgi:signal transduction histidine kinase
VQFSFVVSKILSFSQLMANKYMESYHPPPPVTAALGGNTATHKGFFWAARTQILLWYMAILLLVFFVSIPAFRQLLTARVEQRVQQYLDEKAAVFKGFLAGKPFDEAHLKPVELNRPQPNQPFQSPATKAELAAFFNDYLVHQIPEDEVYIITFVAGRFYQSSPRGRPAILQPEGQLMQSWATQTLARQGRHASSDREIGHVLYRVEPVVSNGQTLGVLVIAHTTAGEQAEALEAVSVVVIVIAGVLLIAMILAGLAAGRVLSPLRSLGETTRLISESDLSQRLTVTGSGQITELAQSFNDMLDRLQIAFVSQRNFINDAGHELRTPITIIRGHLELMGDDPTEQAETLTIVIDELDRMTRLVDDLILLAKSEQPDFLQLESFDLSLFMADLLTKARALAERNWQLEGNVIGTARLDRQRLTQAVMNLAENATQYTQSSDTIAIGVALRHQTLHLWVRDTGAGIAPNDQTRIFERFARATNSRRRSEGAGLGLAIVQAIIQAHAGQLTLYSQLGAGSTFSMLIPLPSVPED